MTGLAILALILWALPIAIGGLRGVDNLGSIVVIDLFLSWTALGWVVALAMACGTVRRTERWHGPPGPPQPPVPPV
jgi:hypothetical protein